MINNDQSTLLLYCCKNVKSHRSGGDNVPLNFRKYYKRIQNLQKCFNARILQHFAIKFCDVTNFKMFILAVVMDFVLPAKIKIYL